MVRGSGVLFHFGVFLPFSEALVLAIDFYQAVPMFVLGLNPNNSWLKGLAPLLRVRLIAARWSQEGIWPEAGGGGGGGGVAFLCSGGSLF